MAKTTKMTKMDKTDQPSFEKALADLEHVVDKLEKGGLALNESLALFEKGVKLARFLRDELDRAEKKVEILLKDEKGEVHAEPFDIDDEDAGDAAAAEEPEKKTRPRSPKKKPEGGDDTLPF